VTGAEPPKDCSLCPRLASFRAANRLAHPDYFNNPVPSFIGHNVRLLIVGLAPGLHGANKTGRPFTGDWAGDLLYATLLKHGLARGVYAERADDGLELVDCGISNAVRCVPPENKPTPAEIKTCRQFLNAQIAALPHLRAILALGKSAHDSGCDALSAKKSAHPFKHGAAYTLPLTMAGPDPAIHPSTKKLDGRIKAAHGGGKKITLVSSYHCSRYNTNTGVLTEVMFDAVVKQAKIAALHAL
jgi:uracil-DNA glycosylase family 4